MTVRRGWRISINGRFLARRPTGVDRFAHEIVRGLDGLLAARDPAAAGLQIQMLVPHGSNVATGAYRHIDVKHVPGSGQSWEQIALPAAARGTLLLNLCNTGPLWFRNQVTVLHDAAPMRVPDAYTRAFRTWYRMMAPCIGRVARRVLTVSEFSRRELEAAYRIPRAKIGVVPESGEHMLREHASADLRERFGIGERPYVLAVGSTSRHKNFGLLLDAIELLGATDYQFVIVGANLPIFRSAAQRLPKSARHLGYVSDADLKALFAHASCFVFPSLYEGYGLPPVEAMTLGCPVIASDIPPVREACGDAALYASPQSAKEFAAAISAVMTNSAFRGSLAARGLDHARRLSWRTSAITLLREISPWLA